MMYQKTLRPKAEVFYNHVASSVREVAKLMNVSKSTAHRWIKNGDTQPTKTRQTRTSMVRQIVPVVQTMVQADPFLTSKGIQDELEKVHGVALSATSILRAMRLCNLSYKRAARSKDHSKPDLSHPFFHNNRVYENAICLDEAAFVSSDTPRYGWSKIGTDVPKPPLKTRRTLSLLLAISKDEGIVGYQIRKGSFNSQTYSEFIKGLPRNRTLIMDNVQFHKCKLVRDVAQSRNQTCIYTPPYSPWMNPVEHGFSVTKHFFRLDRHRMPGKPLEDAIVDSLRTLTTTKCKGFFEDAEVTRQDCLADTVTPRSARRAVKSALRRS